MKRRAILILFVLLAVLAIAAPMAAFTTNNSNPFSYGWQFTNYAPQPATNIQEPGKPAPANPAWTYYHADNPNFVVPR